MTEAEPFIMCDQNGGLCAAPGHDLRTALHTGVKQLAKAGFGILDGPAFGIHA